MMSLTEEPTLIVRSPGSSTAAGPLILRVVLSALLLLFVAGTWADPDLWGHVKFGGDIAATGIHERDPYSFTSDRAWINHEWLAELIIHRAWTAAGNIGLIAVKTALVLVALALVLGALHQVAMSGTLRILLLFTAVAGLWARIYVFRPQVFSVVLFACLLYVLRGAEPRPSPALPPGPHPRGQRAGGLWIVPLLFAAWVNLHGGWIVGLGVLAVWSAANLTSLGSMGVPARRVLSLLLLSVAATLLNPYGAGMWMFLLETVRLGRSMIADWQPLFATGPGKVAAWGTAAVFAAVAIAHRRPPLPLAHAAIATLLGLVALRVSRLDAFFSLAVVMLLAPQIASFAEGRRRALVAPLSSPAALVVPAATGALLAVLVAPARFSCVRLDGPWMPEREAAAAILENRLEGRLLSWFDWGQYAIWHFAPRLQVSFDGRRETVYSHEFLSRHSEMYFEPERAGRLLDELDADYAWLPRTLPLTVTLQRGGWVTLFEGRESVILAPGPRSFTPPHPLRTPPCFPGP